MLRLLQLSIVKYSESASGTSRNCRRVMSPPGASTFTTSAPSHASNCVAEGPDCTCVMSSTRTPSSANVVTDHLTAMFGTLHTVDEYCMKIVIPHPMGDVQGACSTFESCTLRREPKHGPVRARSPGAFRRTRDPGAQGGGHRLATGSTGDGPRARRQRRRQGAGQD